MSERNPWEHELRALLDAGEVIEAIKLYRERTGAGLKEAKDAVDALRRGASLPDEAGGPAGSLEDDVVRLMERGQKIEAIKVYRERTGLGLKEAKEAVERLAVERGIAAPSRAGCFGALALTVFIAFSIAGAVAGFGDEEVTLGPATRDDNGFLVHEVRSPFQAGTTRISLLLPDRLAEGRKHKVVYVLPVEKGTENRYGDGLLEIKRRDLHNKHNAIFVAPTFSHLPWYADHPTDASIRQESYLLKAVVPQVEKTYPALSKSEGRLLLGFSKSGWGAWSLLLRHPDTFARAAAWDAPLTMDRPGQYGSGEIFGPQENFDKYRITTRLKLNAEKLAGTPRLVLTGYGSFREPHQRTHDLLLELKIPHVYRDGPPLKHDWHSGWVAEAVELLVAPAD